MAERNEKGQFADGYKGGPGRPKKEREEKYLEITLNTVTFADWERVVAKARDQALKGDAVARNWLSAYLIGPPVQKLQHSGEDGGPIQVEDVTLTDEQRAAEIARILDAARARQAGQADPPAE